MKKVEKKKKTAPTKIKNEVNIQSHIKYFRTYLMKKIPSLYEIFEYFYYLLFLGTVTLVIFFPILLVFIYLYIYR